MVYFDETTVKLLQKIQFQEKVIEFVLGLITCFEKEVLVWKITIKLHQYQSENIQHIYNEKLW